MFCRMKTTLSHAMTTSFNGFGHHSLSILSFLITIECIISLELLELRVPAHVALGTRAQLSCRWELGPTDILYSLKWYKDGKEFFRHVPRDTEPRRKFPLPGVDVEKYDSSGSTLLLSEVVLASAGRYRCEVSGERPLFATVSRHADMTVVELPGWGPEIRGLRTRYRVGDRLQVNCTSGPSRPACSLFWYVNGEPAPATATPPPTYQVHGDQLQTSLLLDLTLTEYHFVKNGIKVKCLATIATLYWHSIEEGAVLERPKIYETMLPNILATNYTADRDISNLARAFNSSLRNIITALLATSFLRFCVGVS